MTKIREFANLQVLCHNQQIAAKKVFTSLFLGYKAMNTDVLQRQFDFLYSTFGSNKSLSHTEKRAIQMVFKMQSSPPYFLRQYDDGWVSVLHERFSTKNIASYAMRYSKAMQDHPLIAIAYDERQFLCMAFQEGKVLFTHRICQQGLRAKVVSAMETELFAEMIGSTQDDVLRMVNAEYGQQLTAVSHLFKHPVVVGIEAATRTFGSSYTKVPPDDDWI